MDEDLVPDTKSEPSSIIEEGGFIIAKTADGGQVSIKGDDLALYVPFELEKVDKQKRMVYGYASTEALDGQGEIVERVAVEEALPEYSRWRNIREMHRPSAVGIAPVLEMREKGLYIGAKVVDDNAWNKVLEGVYKGFSIGGRALKRASRFLETLKVTVPTIQKMKLTEISLVDRPANPECTFALAKMDGSITETEEPKGGFTLKRLIKGLTDLLKGAQTETAELAKVVGSEDAAASLVESVGKLDEDGATVFFKNLASSVSFDLEKACSGGKKSAPKSDNMDEEEMETDGKPKKPAKKDEGEPEMQKTDEVDLKKMIAEDETIKSLTDGVSSIKEILEKLSGEDGIQKMATDLEEVKKSVEESKTAHEGVAKSVQELETRLTTLEESRGIRRSANEGGTEDKIDDSWGAVLLGA